MPARRSLLQSRAQPQCLADCLAHPPFGPLGTARCPGQRTELPRQALLLGLRQHVAAPFIGELAGKNRVHLHVSHLLSVPSMNGMARPAATPVEWEATPLPKRCGCPCCDHGWLQSIWQIATTALLAEMITSPRATDWQPGAS